MGTSLFDPHRCSVIGALTPLLQDTPAWQQRYEIEWYVWKCIDAGFCKTDDQVRQCAERWIDGKRKVTPPGTQRRKNEAKKKAKLLANVPIELTNAINSAVTENEKAVKQYQAGNEKALNSLVGSVMKKQKADPAIVKELLIKRINQWALT